MKAIAVSKYGGVENLVATEVETPSNPQGNDVLIEYDPFYLYDSQTSL